MIDHEEWRPVGGFPNYQVSSLGRIMSQWPNRKPRILVGSTNGRPGYRVVTLWAGDERTTRTVHRIVADAFLGLRPEGMEILHRDGDKRNNAVSNLRHGTKSENELDKVRHGVHRNAHKTHCPQDHLYDEVNTYLDPSGKRHCRTCMRYRRQARAFRAAGLAA